MSVTTKWPPTKPKTVSARYESTRAELKSRLCEQITLVFLLAHQWSSRRCPPERPAYRRHRQSERRSSFEAAYSLICRHSTRHPAAIWKLQQHEELWYLHWPVRCSQRKEQQSRQDDGAHCKTIAEMLHDFASLNYEWEYSAMSLKTGPSSFLAWYEQPDCSLEQEIRAVSIES